ncbi:MAG: dienelactone hydrolase family protein, partial [Pseudomonadota bacterium]|nr:dienelactone hydrolase family protein [Pseudomonadota bacterium]
GYVGFALDVYGKGVLGSSVEENTRLMTPFMEDRNHLQERLTVAYETLKQQPQVEASNIAAIGYCFGGLCVLDMVRSGLALAGVASFHGILKPSSQQKNNAPSKSKVLILHGDKDPMVAFDDLQQCRAELAKLGCDWRMHIYSQALHAFTNPDANDPKLGTVYNKQADAHSSLLLWDFLRELFDVPSSE